jgi:[phosphatase 2A protein]-leucine-carboxy methyltransferase
VEAFLASNQNQNVQIISLGAGTDTRYWRLREKNPQQKILYHEIDFPVVSKNKLAAIRYSQKLSPMGSGFFTLHEPKDPIDPENTRWGFYLNTPVNTAGYFFHPIDLRKMPPRIDDLQTGDVPSLLISECCLCYLSPDEAQSVIHTFSNLIPNLGIVIYEPTNPNSEFGKVMSQNLAMRGLSMPTIQKYPTLQSQLHRLRDAGFLHSQNGADILWLWNNWVHPAEKERIYELEMLDEVEEWELLAKHYIVIWGWRELGSQGHFTEWKTSCPSQIQYPQPAKVAGQEDEDAEVKIEDVQ